MSRLLKLYDRALREGFNVNYVKREDDAGVCRPVVNVNKDATRWCWRFYTPENECDMIEDALNEAGKLYGVASASNAGTERRTATVDASRDSGTECAQGRPLQ